jgi:hypothetical protein
MFKLKALNINKKFYKKLGFWVGLSLLYETFELFHHDQLFFNNWIIRHHMFGIRLGCYLHGLNGK